MIRRNPAARAAHMEQPEPMAGRRETGGPLAGVRVLDLTTVVMGPFATQILADLGADVVKVEPPGGDILRHIAPMKHPGMGHIFIHHNRNKRSIVLDLKRPEGRQALLRLARSADVLAYNVRPQAMARLGLTYREVRAVNPRILYVGAYGYGENGPYAGEPAYDDLIQGRTGLPHLYFEAGADRPRYVPTAISDRVTGLAMVNAIAAALYWRERSGEGQAIEVPMFETMAQIVLGDHLGGRTFEPPIEPYRYARMVAAHRLPYATKDGYVCVLVYNDKHWRSFLELVGRAELLETDPRFSSQEARSRHIGEVYEFVAEQMATRTSGEWLRLLKEADIPVAPLNSVDDLIEDLHLRDTGFIVRTRHPSEGALREMGVPSRWSATPPGPLRPAPRLGEHSREILREAGYADAEIEAMIASGVTTVAQPDTLAAS
jgi:crotonobetainyl-CoA:carnitine CoA-transferase CaiB-like acyl-CoA transferase